MLRVSENITKYDLNSIIDDLNRTVFNGEITDIVEVTYAYKKLKDGTYFNETLFSDFLGENFEDIDGFFLGYTERGGNRFNKNKFLEEIKTKVTKKLKSKLKKIDSSLEKLANLESLKEADYIRKELLEGSLKYVRNTLQMALLGLPFELEKAGLKHDLSKQEVGERIIELEKLEKQNFGGKIKENPEELILAYEYLCSKYKQEKDKLSQEERQKYENKYLKEIERLLPRRYTYNESKESNNQEELEREEILEKKVHRSKYIPVFKYVFEILNLDFDVVEDERSSIYDGPNALHIPLSKEYDNLTIKRIVELIGHEIESHCSNLRNNKKLIGLFRSAGNLTKEEGLAIVVENLLNGKKLEDITVPQHFPKVLMAELFAGNDLKEFLDIQNKIEPDNGHDGRFLRLNRNYPLDYIGGQHKDASYGRGVLEVVKYIKDGGDIRDLYLGKVSVKDIPKVKRLMELEGIGYDKLKLPLFIGELVLFCYEYINNNLNSRRKKNITQDNFISYLKEKYPPEIIDFSKIEIPVVSFFQKRKLLSILNALRDFHD